MRISAISNVNFRQTTQVEDKSKKAENNEPKDNNNKQGLTTKTKTLIGAGVVAAGALAIYFITRNPKTAKKAAEATSKAASDASGKENIKNPIDEVNKKIQESLKDFKSDIQDISETIVEKLDTGFTRITYSGKNKDGHELKDMLFFNKNNELTQRMIEQTTPDEQIKIIYKGDNAILAKPDEISGGRYNPKYFQRQITKSNMEKHGDENVQDSAFYSQTTSIFDNKGTFKDITRRYKTDERKTKISTNISQGTVEIKENADTKVHEFNWDTKKEIDKKNIGFAYTDDHKLNAYYTRQSIINGKNVPDDSVILKYRDRKYGIVYQTHNEMIAHEPDLYKRTQNVNPQPKPEINSNTSEKSISASSEKEGSTSTSNSKKTPLKNTEKKPKEFIQGFELGSEEADNAVNKLNPKAKNYLENSFFSEFDDLTHRNIAELPQGKTKVEYTGISDYGDKYRETVIFDKEGEFKKKSSKSYINDLETKETTETLSTQTPDNKTRITTIVSDSNSHNKKNCTVQENGEIKKEIRFGYDKNSNPVGYAYTQDNKVILKLNDKKFGQVFDSFEDISANVNPEEFKTL